MKKNKLILLISLQLSLITQFSCASFMSNWSEKKDIKVISSRDLKEIVSSEIVPEFGIKNKSLMVKVMAKNTYSNAKEETTSFKKDIPWAWGIGTFGLSFGGAIATPVWDSDSTKTLLSTAGIAIGVTALDYLFSNLAKEGTDKKITKSDNISQTIAVANANVNIKIDSLNFKGVTDENGTFYIDDIDPSDISKNVTSNLTVKYNSKDYPVTFNSNKVIKLFPVTTEFAKNETKEPIKEVIKEASIPSKTTTMESLMKSDIDINIIKTGKINKDGIAIIIGNKNYKNNAVPSVDYALKDSKIVKEYVQKVFGYRDVNTEYLEDATQGDFIKLFGNETDPNGKLADLIKEGKSDIFIYYSGHGAPDTATGDAYFVPVDADPTLIRLNGYKLETFYNNLSKLKAKSITVVLDSCFSGGSDRGMLIRNASPIFIDVKKQGILAKIPSNFNVLTSSSGQQISSWFQEKEHSMFTYYFLKAIQLGNKTDEDGDKPDLNGDGNLTLNEIHEYVSEKTKYMAKRLYSRKQEPQLITGSKNSIFLKY